MSKIPLTTGAYQAKSVIAGAQRCVNLFMEVLPNAGQVGQPANFPTVHYPTPGITLKATSTQSGWRGLYFATNGVLYGVCGTYVYAIDQNFNLTQIGTITSMASQVQMVDNGVSVILVDGSSAGYTIDMNSNAFAPIASAAFYGSPTISMTDGYFVLTYPGTREWYISLNTSTSFDATDFASKGGFPDKMVGNAVTRRYVFLFGEQTTEIWYNSGDAAFPFQRMPGSFIQYGCAAVNSIAQMDGEIYWLAQSPQGKALVCRSSNFAAAQISTFAIDAELQGYQRLDDAIGFTYQLNGHFFYVLTFPTDNKTWVYDLSNSQWHEWLYLDNNGNFNRHRANCFAFAYGKQIVGDWENGNLYEIDQDVYTDNGQPISRIRSWYHIADNDSNRVRFREFIAEMETGNGDNFNDVPVYLRYSDDRGRTFSNAIESSLGKEGEYLTSIQFQRLGYGRDRVFELSWSAPVKTALTGAYVQAASNNQ